MVKQEIEDKVREYSKLVYRIANTMLNRKEDVEDVFQEVFIKYCKNFDKLKKSDYEKAWIIKVTTNECKNYLKRESYRKHEDIDEQFDLADKENDQNEILNEIEKLDPKYRIVIFLYYFEGYKEKEISQILSISVSGVKTRIKRAKEFLKIQIEGGKING